MSSLSWVEGALDARLGTPPAAGGQDGAALEAALREASSGGKRFRPALVAAVHAGLGGRRPGAVAAVGAAVELLHTALVVHDDIIDGDRTRRGRPSLPARFETAAAQAGAAESAARTYGLAGALLTGDLALSAAVRAVATAPAPRPVVERMLDLLDHALTVTASGELADVRFATHGALPTLGEVLCAEERKTAVYSFALPMQLGAVLADADEEQVAALDVVGRHLGLAFQLRDDLLGVFGDESLTGKSTTSDIREGKCTALVVHASDTEQWDVIKPLWGDPEITSEGAAAFRAALEDAGSRNFIEQLVEDYLQAATRSAHELGLTLELVDWLGGLCVAHRSGAA